MTTVAVGKDAAAGLDGELGGRVALVTGASQGLGRTLALRLAAAGIRVVVNHVADGCDAAAGVVAEIKSAGGEGWPWECDVADEAAVNRMFAGLQELTGGVDILVNNARIDPYFRRPEMSEGEWWDMVLAVNLKGAFLTSFHYLAQARERGWGRIVNISSVRAFTPAEPGMVAYGVSKLGMHALTRSFATQGAPHGITANSIAPGMIVTENIARRLTPEMYERGLAEIPLGRGGSMAEVVDAIMFVIANGYVTGETININGGMWYGP